MSCSCIDIGNRKQLFIDERWFAVKRGIRLCVNPPQKVPVNWPEAHADESHGVHAYLNVIQDDAGYRMWYGSHPAGSSISEFTMRLAQSEDGITWHKPELNLLDIPGIVTNNVVMTGAYGSVIYDPHAPEAQRYKAVCDIYPNTHWEGAADTIHGGKQADGSISYFMALYLLTSPDGLRWQRAEKFASPFFHDSQNQLLYDRRLGRYVAYLRWLAPNRPRCVARIEIDDPMDLPWPYRHNLDAKQGPGGTLERLGDEIDTVLMTEPGTIDPEETDIYCPCVTQYPYADDTYYLSFMPMYRHYPDPDGDTQDTALEGANTRGRLSNDGPVDIRLATSADGISWTRPDYRAYLGLGLDWDRGSVYMAPGIFRHGNELRQYYVGFPVTHGQSHDGRVGMTVQRLDGFISADADYGGGAFTTPLMRFEGNRLTLNVDCSAMGCVTVEIRDEHNQPIPGYELADCEPVDLNHLAAEVRWAKGPSVAALAGRPISLHVQMRDCKLFAFQFEN